MKADTNKIKLYSVFKNFKEKDYINSNEYSPIIIHDEHRIKQILLNFQSNALKYTQKGEVKIIVSIVGSLDPKEQEQEENE